MGFFEKLLSLGRSRGRTAGRTRFPTPGQVGQSFAVLTSSQPLTGDFANYEGLGFFDGLYLKPVIQGNTLSLEVAAVPGGPLATTALDVVASFAGGTVSLSVDSPGV